jgi:heterodisulfide reductase subunit C
MPITTLIQMFLFAAITIGVFALAGKKYMQIYKNIKLGKPYDYSGNTNERVKNMLLIAFGQKKMFKEIGPAMLHMAVYLAFLVTQVELIEIFIDGFTGSHRLLLKTLGGFSVFYGLYALAINAIEILSVLAFIATFIFLARRNLLKVPRLVRKPEMSGWPVLDANIILLVEIYLIICIFMMNGADQVLNFNKTGDYYPFLISGLIGPALFGGLGEGALVAIERIGWWGHILGVLGFLLYLPHSKHLHIMLAFPNTFFSKLTPKGKIENMPAVTNEIKLMMDPNAVPPETTEIPTFGAKDVTDLTWKSLLDAYTCTECGRCTEQCPAAQTGKKLSPRKVMMDTRDRLEEVAINIKKNGAFVDDGKSLISDEYISVEELRACTTCNACVEACPVTINPLDIIVELRRNLILEQSNSPEEWNNMFGNIENNGAPWKFSPQDRFNWAND